MKYELFYLIGASKEAEIDKIKEEVKKIVAENGGIFEEKETQEKRRLAYKVKHETHGTYIAQRFELSETENIKDINSKINLHSGVLRFVISKASELPELKSKEERISEAAERETKARTSEKVEKTKESSREAAPKAKAEKKPEKVEEKAKEEKKKEEVASDDIDKKLEEILNI